MATTTPPGPPPPPQPPLPPLAPRGPRRVPSRTPLARAIPFAALIVVIAIGLAIVLSSSGKVTYYITFAEADQLVRGNTVQVGGVPVGSITDVSLTKGFKARVTIEIDSSLAPLHHGTVAQVRVPSLSSVANRYIELSLGPNNYAAYPPGSTLPVSATREEVDLDALFNTLNPRTLKGLQGFIRGNAEQYEKVGRQLGASSEYFAPALSSLTHVFAELSRDQPTFTRFLIETGKALTTIAARREQLADLIENSNHTFQALGAEQEKLASGLKQLPLALRQGNRTFAELPGTFAALEELVLVSRPTTPQLRSLLEHLRPLLRTATPALHNLNLAVNRPGPNNDLTDLARALPALARSLESASPSSVRALQESVPITAFFGPYAPDLAGTLRTFGQAAAYYDANGNYARLQPVLPDFKLGQENNLTPATPQQAFEALRTGQLRRCPGAATEPAADGSSPFTDGELLSCIPSETP